MKVWGKILAGLAALLAMAALPVGCTTITDGLAGAFFLPKDGRPGTYAVVTERRVGFTTSDGVELLADVHHPKGAGKTPTLL